jgi:CTP synthase
MYVNIDAGTMRPTEHGEVFVGEDGIEADQDLGNYERFTNQVSLREHYITTGQVYQEVIRRERNLEYDGEDVEVVPDIPNEIIRRIQLAARKDHSDIAIVEIGGTVGEYQNILFLEAGRMLKVKHPDDVIFVLVSYLPIPSKVGEMKTKPTQHASRMLNAAGIQADFILCRAEEPLDQPRRNRLSLLCNMPEGHSISAPDVDSIYEVPVMLEKEHLGEKIVAQLKLRPRKSNMRTWQAFVRRIRSPQQSVHIAVVGKYFGTGEFVLADSYISVIEAIKHASWFHRRKPVLTWIDAEKFEKDPPQVRELDQFDGILVPGGFGSRGVEGIIQAIQRAREKGIPYFGLCYGMQLATVEFARHVAKLRGAHTTEVNPKSPHPVISANSSQKKNIQQKNFGGSMRLGTYPCVLDPSSKSAAAYQTRRITERHRHRYEFDNAYRDRLERVGMKFPGICPTNHLVEIIELQNHPWFVATQFHPEFKSRPMEPHPLFRDFIRAAIRKQKKGITKPPHQSVGGSRS